MLLADEISVRFPAKPGYLHISRLNASAIGTEAGLDVEELQDLRLAVNEAVGWLLLDADGDGQVELQMSASEGTVTIRGSRVVSGELPEREPDSLLSAVLGATLDSYHVTEVGTGRGIEMQKSSQR